MTNPTYHETKHFWLYVLALEDDCYYVGITSRADPQERIREHKNGYYTAQWVRLHKYQSTVEIIDLGDISKADAEAREDQLTLDYMNRFGRQKVRGGRFSYSGEIIKFGRSYYRDSPFYINFAFYILAAVIVILMVALVFKS